MQVIFTAIAGFPEVIGGIDGTHVMIVAPREYKWPGSVHDARILVQSGLCTIFDNGIVPAGCHLQGDSDYPSKKWLLTPYLRPQSSYNRAHKKTCSVVERHRAAEATFSHATQWMMSSSSTNTSDIPECVPQAVERAEFRGSRDENWTRLDKDQYHRLLELVTPLIAKSDTKMRKAVTAGERLTLTLRYLATGESQVSLAYQFCISHNLISSIIPSVCRAIYQVLQPQYLYLPRNQSEWQHVASQYYARWNFPMCIGVLDGKRVLISKPPCSGSEYYDYKGHFSLIMMALVDADYKFMYVDVGASGRASDAGVWRDVASEMLLREKK
ncbi:uncharacterized protein LOC123507728 [Portunus trituberculatus]|uniref:uncharacterized protein LOC123507728 n=1 Tax=Portunus trituberculatus TaxID=210409 RepID=UPI001E1CF7B0|nr:uncharacterized protein LOC123507728 [Portunus trituberculatus]